ncbi:MAG: hypothetical protein M3Y72_12955 [Acidobacteriota bacterium]|nr:hypothetical protein [Acidobacteriota bacterium]
MLRQRKTFVLAACLIGTMLVASTAGSAAECKGYALASIEGEYAVVGTYAGEVAGLIGVSRTDRNGNVEGSALVNIPGTNNTRLVVPISWTGVQIVNEDGTGTVSLTITLPNATQTVTQDFVITKAAKIDGVLKATELRTMQREPSGLVAGEFITDVLTRRPD